jgi:hypothetical protein
VGKSEVGIPPPAAAQSGSHMPTSLFQDAASFADWEGCSEAVKAHIRRSLTALLPDSVCLICELATGICIITERQKDNW